MSRKLVPSLLNGVDAILKIRDGLGADLRKIYLVTRAWSGRTVGEGTVQETEEEILPTPRIKLLKIKRRISQAGGLAVEADISVESISKNQYPSRDTVGCRTTAKNVEKFYRLGEDYYEVVDLTERHLVWDVLLRRKTDQRRRATDGN